MGVNVSDLDVKSYFYNTETSTLTIMDSITLDQAIVMCKIWNRDCDILEESLGNATIFIG